MPAKFTSNRLELLSAIKFASSVVSTRTKPVLACCLINVGIAGIGIDATDLELRLCQTLRQVQPESPGAFCINAADFLRVVNSAGSDAISIEVAGDMARISSDDASFRLPVLPAEEFPALQPLDAKDQATIEVADLTRLLRQSSYAAGGDMLQFVMGGILLSVEKKVATCAATDGKRVAFASAKAKGKDTSAILSQSNVSILAKVIADAEDPIKFYIEANRIAFEIGETRIYSNVLEGTFPPYRSVMHPADRKFTAGAESLKAALSRAMVCSVSEDEMAITIECGPKGLRIIGQDGPSESVVQFACKYEGEPDSMIISGAKLVEGLSAFDCDEVTVEFASQKPLIVRGVGEAQKGEECVYLQVQRNLKK